MNQSKKPRAKRGKSESRNCEEPRVIPLWEKVENPDLLPEGVREALQPRKWTNSERHQVNRALWEALSSYAGKHKGAKAKKKVTVRIEPRLTEQERTEPRHCKSGPPTIVVMSEEHKSHWTLVGQMAVDAFGHTGSLTPERYSNLAIGVLLDKREASLSDSMTPAR